MASFSKPPIVASKLIIYIAMKAAEGLFRPVAPTDQLALLGRRGLSQKPAKIVAP